MGRREWSLVVGCGHVGCTEQATYRYASKRELVESFERKHYTGGRWRCVRHTRPNEVLSPSNRWTRAELTVEQKPHGLYFGNSGFIAGPGFKAWAADFPPGTRVVVSAELILPDPRNGTPTEGGDAKQAPFMGGPVPEGDAPHD